VSAVAHVVLPNVEEPDDQAWFADHPERLFRARAGDGGACLIRRRPRGANPDAYLRTFSTKLKPKSDADDDVAARGCGAAHPDWPIKLCRKWAHKALKRCAP
jgi:hypothetical protein